MPAVDTVLLPLCVGLTLLGVIATGVAWRRGSKGRVIQGLALALAPIALYFSGLLRLLWNGVVAVGSWASGVIFSPAIWFGLSLLGLCIVLWVVGALVTRRFPAKSKKKVAAQSSSGKSVAAGRTATPGSAVSVKAAPRAKAPAQPSVDDDMAEIEALLKSRGIQ
jgi:hypothetical protein